MAVVVTLNIMLRGQSVCNCRVRLVVFFCFKYDYWPLSAYHLQVH